METNTNSPRIAKSGQTAGSAGSSPAAARSSRPKADSGLPPDADPNATTSSGETPLHYAATWHCDLELVALLIARGADLDARTHADESPLNMATKWATNRCRSSNDFERLRTRLGAKE